MMFDLIEKEKLVADEIDAVKAKGLKASDGTEVCLLGAGINEKITVRSNEGQIVFEYDVASRKYHLYAPEGDLHLAAPNGSVAVSAGQNITMKCPGDIVIEGRDSVLLNTGMPLLGHGFLRLGKKQAELSADKIGVRAKRGDFSITRSRWRSQSFMAKITRTRASIDFVDLLTEKMYHRTKDLRQVVDDLLQINAGRMRTFVRGLFNLKGQRTYFKADKDMKLKGDRIHLR